MKRVRAAGVLLLLILAAAPALAQGTVSYRLSFPEREHRLMDVDVTFTDVPEGPLQVHMSRSSPGRYAPHEFAKNVFDVRVTDGAGQALAVTRTSPQQWTVPSHHGTVQVFYRIFGDRTDGTYLAIDSTHAHVNMPSALMWAAGLERRPVQVRFELPPGSGWRVATQLFPGADDVTFTAPNLQYLMDSPSELSAFDLRTFTVQDGGRTPTFRLAIHHNGDGAELDSFARDAEKVVREARNVFGEYAPFDGGTYTFIADYLPYASGDGMEHRNSTIVTSSAAIRSNRADLLDTMAHEFFHSWNVERIRPRALEPFDFTGANMSGELWLAEGFTSYYAPLITRRAGLTNVREFAQEMGRAVNTVATSPGRRVRSAEEMSQQAPFVDAATAIDRTSFENTFISYYTWGEALGLGLDLSLRERSGGRVTLDHFMRALWEKHGKPGGAPGYVDKPYTMDDLRAALASVSGDAVFARDFFAKYVQGHDLLEYGALLERAGLVLRPMNPGLTSAGALQLQDSGSGVRVVAPVPFGSPAFDAGLERDDLIVSVGGAPTTSEGDLRAAIAKRQPGDELPIVFERRGARVSSALHLVADPRVEIVTAEDAGRTLTDAQRQFRRAWLGLDR